MLYHKAYCFGQGDLHLVAIHLKATEMPDHIVQAENVTPLSVAKWENYLFLLCHMTHVLKIAFFCVTFGS